MALISTRTERGFTLTAYCRIVQIQQYKLPDGNIQAVILVGFFATKDAESAISMESYRPPESPESYDYAKSYAFLKTLPEFAEAEDV